MSDTDRPRESAQPLTRPSTVFERPPGNVFHVTDDAGTPLQDVTQRPTIIAPVEIDPTEG